MAEIQKSTGAKIDVTVRKDKAITLSIRGKKDQVQEAKKLVHRDLQTQVKHVSLSFFL